MSRYRMSFNSGWESNAFEPFKEVEFKTADKKAIVYSKIVYGEWQWTGDGVYCSVCSYKLQTSGLSVYCPNCGADMRGEV